MDLLEMMDKMYRYVEMPIFSPIAFQGMNIEHRIQIQGLKNYHKIILLFTSVAEPVLFWKEDYQ